MRPSEVLRRGDECAAALGGLRAGIALLVTALVGASATGASERIEGNLYVNPDYGIEIAKPAAWHFVTARAVVELARRSGGMPAGPPDEDPVRAAGFAVIVSKSPTLGRTFDPQVVLLVREVGVGPGDLVQTCEGLRTGMSAPETLSPTREARLDGTPAARLEFRGLVDGDLVRATAVCAIRRGRAFLVVGQALAADFDRETATFETILGSFRLR